MEFHINENYLEYLEENEEQRESLKETVGGICAGGDADAGCDQFNIQELIEDKDWIFISKIENINKNWNIIEEFSFCDNYELLIDKIVNSFKHAISYFNDLQKQQLSHDSKQKEIVLNLKSIISNLNVLLQCCTNREKENEQIILNLNNIETEYMLYLDSIKSTIQTLFTNIQNRIKINSFANNRLIFKNIKSIELKKELTKDDEYNVESPLKKGKFPGSGELFYRNDKMSNEIQESINRANQKEKERVEKNKKINKIFGNQRSTGKDILGHTGKIESVEGEVDSEEEEIDVQYKIQQNEVTYKHRFYDDNDRDNDGDDDDDNDYNDDKTKEVTIEPFNLKSLREEGHFDKDGNFIHRDVDKEQDAWLQEYDNVWTSKLPKLSREQQQAQDEEDDQNADDNDNSDEDLWQKEERLAKEKKKKGLTRAEKSNRIELLLKVYRILNDRESVTGAIKRLAPPKTTVKKKVQKNQSKIEKQDQESQMTQDTNPEKLELFNTLAGSVDKLLSDGFMNIYSETKETMKKLLDKEGYKPTDTESESSSTGSVSTGNEQSSSETLWEYKIGSDDAVYGPFQNSALKQWKDAGYFQSQQVYCRKYQCPNPEDEFNEFTLIDLINF
ncbi:hypothetical protein DLAC_11149 [Tieghemostelium lacteum]|uniref:GYF domain-containing protein n=1 Tax=Tieghemostelium lacteum TaxID=361077 RepID=A0A151Z3R7_TIELA|nr:hypothetical protein DLAC_11149 [Tieghemostelium lacteum]|eukprot:KYQ88444.1 hypothetical protein DLAC_11149 [Tieghemostelium lacteum]